MLFHCQFTWFPGTNRAVVAQRVVQQHDALMSFDVHAITENDYAETIEELRQVSQQAG